MVTRSNPGATFAAVVAVLVAGSPALRAEDSGPGIALTLSVTGADVEVDGHRVAERAASSLKIPLAPGSHVLRVTKDGFVPLEKSVEVPAGPPVRVDFVLSVAAARAVVRIAVHELTTATGADPRVLAIVSEALVTEVRKLDGTSAVGMSEIGDMLSFEQQRQLAGCDDSGCLAEIGGALGVDEIVTGSLGRIGDSTVLTVRRTDLRMARVLGSVTRRFALDTGEELLAAVGPIVEELFPDHPLRPGRTRGAALEAARRLNPPPLQPVVVYALGGGAVVALAVATVSGLQASGAQAEYGALAARSRTEVVDGADLVAVQTRLDAAASATNLALGVAGALLLSGGAAALFTDWWGYGAPPAQAVVLPVDGGGRVVVAFRF